MDLLCKLQIVLIDLRKLTHHGVNDASGNRFWKWCLSADLNFCHG